MGTSVSGLNSKKLKKVGENESMGVWEYGAKLLLSHIFNLILPFSHTKLRLIFEGKHADTHVLRYLLYG
jgi:hypothetical protein